MLLRPGKVADHQVRLADVLVGAPMAGVQLQRPLVMAERLVEASGVAVGEAQEVLEVGVAVVLDLRPAEQLDGARPVLGLDRFLPQGVVGVRAAAGRLLAGIGPRGRGADDGERDDQRRERSQRVAAVRKALASWISVRSASAFFPSAASFSKYSRVFAASPAPLAALAAP
jgi:hypothetical protein